MEELALQGRWSKIFAAICFFLFLVLLGVTGEEGLHFLEGMRTIPEGTAVCNVKKHYYKFVLTLCRKLCLEFQALAIVSWWCFWVCLVS